MQNKVAQRSKDFNATFSSPTGRSVLKDLRSAFDGNLIHENPYIMACNIGKRDVIKYIEERMDEYAARTQS